VCVCIHTSSWNTFLQAIFKGSLNILCNSPIPGELGKGRNGIRDQPTKQNVWEQFPGRLKCVDLIMKYLKGDDGKITQSRNSSMNPWWNSVSRDTMAGILSS
jgi:hypothetical protein